MLKLITNQKYNLKFNSNVQKELLEIVLKKLLSIGDNCRAQFQIKTTQC